MSELRARLAAALGAAIMLPATADAAVIQGLFNTGVDGSGAALAGGHGVVDPHYTIAASTLPAYVGQHAVTYRHNSYAPEDANSRWVAFAPVTQQTSFTTTTYRLSFDLGDLDPVTARITGRWGADNFGTIYLNGVNTGQAIGNQFALLVDFVVASGFRSGLNHLDFVVEDEYHPTAFRVDDIAGTADVLGPPPTGAIPEPSAWAMMILGFYGVGALMRRGHRPAETSAPRDVTVASLG